MKVIVTFDPSHSETPLTFRTSGYLIILLVLRVSFIISVINNFIILRSEKWCV